MVSLNIKNYCSANNPLDDKVRSNTDFDFGDNPEVGWTVITFTSVLLVRIMRLKLER